MNAVISAVLFATLAAPALAQGDYVICQIDHVVHYFDDHVDVERSVAAQLEYLNYDFSLPVEQIEAGVAGPEGVFFHDRTLRNGDVVITEISDDLDLLVTIQMVSISESDWIVARGDCKED